MPEKVNDLKFNNGYAPLSEFPMAFVNSTGTLESSEMPILVRFGTIGSYSSSGWERTNGVALRSKVPRLRGTPTGKIKEMLNVDFSIFNISATMDYSKYQKNEVLEIKELNLYISAGLDAMTGFKVGMINKKDIDDQFRSEINKAIKATIEQQTAELKNKAIKIISENAQLQPTEVETLLKSLFSAVKTKREAL